ncbi:MAG: rhodanese-like domain-containing protein [Myxococcales bacterium]|nr:rhodanese-like domain-containing protein [Myxococcales bacterium]
MKARHLGAVVIAFGLVSWSAFLVWARAPETDAEKQARIAQMYDGFRGLFEGVPEVRVDELDDLKAKHPDLVLVDVRSPEERQVSMLPGAITKEAFEADPAAYADRPVVAYCTIGYRSGQWAKAERAKGVDARNLVGSVLSWTHAGLPLEHDGHTTKRVHVYGSTWNLAHSGYEPVW